jgi:glycine/D-amino acid oxidase-like deaminating enzyme
MTMSGIDPSMAGVHWARTSQEPTFANSETAVKTEYDLAVIGAGFCGLSIAMRASRQGLSVVVLEAGTVGCGASGRNGGFAVPHFPGSMSIDDAAHMLGRERAERLARIVAGGPGYVFDLIRQHEIRCEPEQLGWIQPAHSEKSLGKVRRVFEAWRSRGYDVEWLDAGALHERTGATGYLGGWYGRSGGVVNPYALAQGLARVTREQGTDIRQNEEVVSLTADGPAQILRTSKAEYRARKVVFATNGYTPGLVPGLVRSVIPIRLFHVFTRPLTKAERQATLPARIPFTDLRKSGGFARYDAENRIISGGAVFAAANARAYGERHTMRRIAEIFPQLRGIEIDSYWEGSCALTDAALPAIQQVRDNVFSVIGFSTRGVALSQTLGREVADLLAETKTEAEMPVRLGPVQRIAMQPLKALIGGYAFAAFQVRDRLGLT